MGNVAFITGGARGQGRSHAVALAQAGYDVAICDIAQDIDGIAYPMANAQDLAQTVRLVEEAGGRCLAHTLDVRDLDAVLAFVAQVEADLGPIGVAIANAGVTAISSVTDTTAEQWDAVIGCNLTGVFNVIRAVSPLLRDRRSGRIIAISSMMGRSANPGIPAYAASKWGVIGLAKSAALELAACGVTVNVIAPGNVRTPMIENEWFISMMRGDLADPTFEDLTVPLASLHPMGIPYLEADEITGAVLYLCSDAARHVTGAVFDVNAGASGAFSA